MTTAEPLTSADTDSSIDLYSRTGGNTTLLSTAPGGGNGTFAANFGRAVQAGTKVFFQTEESLSPSDTDPASGGTLNTVAGGGAGANGAGIVQGTQFGAALLGQSNLHTFAGVSGVA